MRIAVDAMGGDFAPKEIVAGAVQAARGLPLVRKISLVGDETAIRAELKTLPACPEKIEIVHASEVVGMEESPAVAIRRKKDSSVGRAVDLVKSGDADAMVSAGNTGAVVVAATLKLRTLDGIERPAIATVMPSPKAPFVLIDAGANTDCTARLLVQFAVMGHVYSREILGQANPVVGLMSVGTEDTKGNEITKEAFRLLTQANLNFKGNIEGHDLFTGEIDVAVCDGFVGNVILKTAESAAHAIATWMKAEFTANWVRMLGALLLRGAGRAMKQRMDPSNYGGAPLLGVNGVCIISHGAAKAHAVFHAVRVACESVSHKVNDQIVNEMRRVGAGS
ncbi:MAG: phosphate acyltransferase PlsX [Lentisphaerae bacterium]|nr:phosphate acyltransferase PlsX [Lentisphaerota bacterium]